MQIKSYKQFISEAGFTHSLHIEDSVLDLGVDGTRASILALKDFRDTFAGSSNKKLDVTVKFDGAPAVVFGTHPETGEFFVGTKSVFSANSKAYSTHQEISSAGIAGGLADKLHDALDYLPLVTPGGRVFQGDFMFSKSDLGMATINNETCIVMHPNTIVYTVPKNSDIGNTISKAKMGIVVHTEYKGKTIQTLSPVFGVDSSSFKKNSNVWLIDAHLQDTTGIGNLTASETNEIDSILSDCGSLFSSVSSNTFKLISTNKQINAFLNKFNNSVIRSGSNIDPNVKANSFIDWLKEQFEANKATNKTERGKANVDERFKSLINILDINELTKIFMLQSRIADGKSFVLGKLNQIGSLGTYLKTADGFKVTNHEGFVGTGGDMAGIKLVDRLEFSHSNFSKDIIKGWAH